MRPFFARCALRRGALLACALAALLASPSVSQTKRIQQDKRPRDQATAGEKGPAAPADFRSQNFFVHTDLAADDAKQLLERLETMLGLISAYWARESSGVIECYVVKDLANWPPGAIPDEGLPHIRAGAGVTITCTLTTGASVIARSVVYAVADRGTPQHEAVHAYCGQAFGTAGPVWYAEGMAEMGKYWRKDDKSVQCFDMVIDYLHRSEPKSLNEIVNGKEFTGDSWQNYAWRWALCHLLANNTNYAAKFRPLGLAFLKKEPASFEQVYGDMAREIMFEYGFFLRHLEQGYRCDLCSWDWSWKKKKKPRALKGTTNVTAKLKADRGWQPAGALVAAGGTYEYKAAGTWRVNKDGIDLTADGADEGVAGRLVAAVLETGDKEQAYSLGDEIELGADGTFTAPAAGQLYLRCRDAWGQLADNQGTLTVKLKAGKRERD
ncbi:MAG TPA: hypothetical protein VGX76_01745 [Pirellulales bacterium]|jgi:hypothetical protein|nr:hypothetical protein [Pirellulales bacterium]